MAYGIRRNLEIPFEIWPARCDHGEPHCQFGCDGHFRGGKWSEHRKIYDIKRIVHRNTVLPACSHPFRLSLKGKSLGTVASTTAFVDKVSS